MIDTIPESLPMAEADPKPWFGSSTIWGGLAGIGAGLACIVASAFIAGYLPADWSAMLVSLGIGQILAGVTVIRGRLKAAQPIARLSGKNP